MTGNRDGRNVANSGILGRVFGGRSGGRRRFPQAALAVGLAVAAAVAAADDNALPVVSRDECNSAVIARCREPLSDQPVVIDPAFPVGGITRRQWGNILNSIPDAGRIVIFGERLHGPGVHAVFTRNLGTERPEQITRKAPGGALCTTSTRSGSTYCSRSGNVMPGVEPPIVQTWSFHF